MLQSSSPSGKDEVTPVPEEETDEVEDADAADALELQPPSLHELALLAVALAVALALVELLLLALDAHDECW